MATPANRGALRALSLTMTALLLSLSVLAPAASALGGLPVNPAPVVRRAIDTVYGVIADAGPCPPNCNPPPNPPCYPPGHPELAWC